MSPDGPWEIEQGIIIVRDGRIEAVGRDLAIPPDLTLIDLPDAVIMPGLVAAASGLARPHTGDESIAAGYRALDAFDRYADYTLLLASGVTTAHLSPGDHRLVTGQGAVVKLGGPLDGRVLSAAADLTVTFGEPALNPPNDVTFSTPASADVPILPGVRQRPDSRLGQYLALAEALARGEPTRFAGMHAAQLVHIWREERPIRIQVQREADIAGALAFMRRHDRKGYLVGAAEANLAVDAIKRASYPVVFRMAEPLRGAGFDIGYDPDALEADLQALRTLTDVKLALAGPADEPTSDLRLAAALAQRAGLSRRRVLEAITRVPAEILGVAACVGSLAPGKDADLVILSGDPLATTTHVRRVYIGGALAFDAPDVHALVVRAGTIWIDETERILDGAVLIEDGIIKVVGHTVPTPPFARLIDAGPDGFVTPGWIDAHGHLGLDGDRAATAPQLSFANLVGVAGAPERRVARAGITTVIVSPYAASGSGSQVTAVKTGGDDRTSRVVRRTTGVLFDVRSADPMKAGEQIKKRLDVGKKYVEKWEKYEKELAEWKEKQAKGEEVEAAGATEEEQQVEGQEDPITGTWEVTISGGPIPEPATASLKLKLTGNDIEGYIEVPGAGETGKVVATLDDKHISGVIEIDTGGMGYPEIEADIVEEDHIVGEISFQGIAVELDANRTDKSPVEFKVVKSRSRGKGGRPIPPKVDEALEPLRAVLGQEIPLVVSVRTAAQISAVLKVVEAFEIQTVLLDANEAAAVAGELVEQDIGVIVPTRIVRRRNSRAYHQADDLWRKGLRVAFQSDAEDGARTLPLIGLHAVERGLSPDAALSAMTTGASRMFNLDDRIGSLEAGLDGDLVIFNGHPFAAGSAVQRVIINGKEVR